MKETFRNEIEKTNFATDGIKHNRDFNKSELINFIKSNEKVLHAIVQHLRNSKTIVYNHDLKKNFLGEKVEKIMKPKKRDLLIIEISKRLDKKETIYLQEFCKEKNKTESNIRMVLSKSKSFKVSRGIIIKKDNKPIEPTNKPNMRYIENPKLETYDTLFTIGTDEQKELLYNYCINQDLFKHTDKLSSKIEAVEIHDGVIRGHYKSLASPSW